MSRNLYRVGGVNVWVSAGCIYVQHTASYSVPHCLTRAADSLLEANGSGDVINIVYTDTAGKVMHTRAISSGTVFIASPCKELRVSLRDTCRV